MLQANQKRVIFLDFDGVLHPPKALHSHLRKFVLVGRKHFNTCHCWRNCCKGIQM